MSRTTARATGSGANQEGDPNLGDIRIGGYAFGNSTLAYTAYPPSVNNYSIAGDINFNTSLPFNIGSTYDLETVAAHEFGHALGLGESSTSRLDVMYPTYNGIKLNLAADDIAGIQSIYSSGLARTPDSYLAQNSSFATAANLDSTINMSSLTALQYNLDIATAGQAEFFSVDAPTGSSGMFEVTAQSLGLSLLTPKITVYASDMATVLGSSTGTGYLGSDPTVALSGVTAGERLYVEVQGANTTQMGTGNYALGMSFNAAAVPPTEASPIIAYPNGTPLQGGGGSPDQAQSGTSVSYGGTPSVTGISPDTGAAPPMASPMSTGSSSTGLQPATRRSWCTSTGRWSARQCRARTVSGRSITRARPSRTAPTSSPPRRSTRKARSAPPLTPMR